MKQVENEASTESQLEVYARDLQRLSKLERDASARLDSMRAQLESYASDLSRSFGRTREHARELEETYRNTLLVLARAIGLRDRETGQHGDRLTAYARLICEELELSAEETGFVGLAAQLHDLGKIGVPDSILLKPGELDDQEWKVMRAHCGMGASLLRGNAVPWLRTAHDAALTHHESFDGSGYPQGLRGEEIPLCGRIVKLADCYDAMRSERAYKPSAAREEVRRAILAGNGRIQPEHFDPALLAVFDRRSDDFDRTFRSLGGG